MSMLEGHKLLVVLVLKWKALFCYSLFVEAGIEVLEKHHEFCNADIVTF